MLNFNSKCAPEILFAGPIPPPVNGMAAVNAELIDLIREDFSVHVLPTSTGAHGKTFLHILSKIWLILRAAVSIFIFGWRGSRVLYASVDDGWGMVGTISFAFAGRASGTKVILHHHSFKYLLKKSWLMRVLVRVAGRAASHVMLCQRMAEQFCELYRKSLNTVIMPNVVKDVAAITDNRKSRRFTLGLLSNLTFEKGLADFMHLHQAFRLHEDCDALLAGPVIGARENDFLERSIEQDRGRVRWLGPVYGADKSEFFSSIDVFVFPSNYRTESFGLVIMEALLHGVPIIAIERGCMCEMKGLDGCYMIGPESEFEPWAIEKLRGLIDKWPEGLLDARRERSIAAKLLNDERASDRERVLDELLS